MQSACADIFGLVIYEHREARQRSDSVIGKDQFDTFGFEQRDVLLDECVLRFRKDAHKIRFRKRTQFYAQRQTGPAAQG